MTTTAPQPHHLTDPDIRRARRRFGTAPVLQKFGSWAVTEYGVECLTEAYWVEFDRVNEPDWETHMAAKTWCRQGDFRAALRAARERQCEVALAV